MRDVKRGRAGDGEGEGKKGRERKGEVGEVREEVREGLRKGREKLKLK